MSCSAGKPVHTLCILAELGIMRAHIVCIQCGATLVSRAKKYAHQEDLHENVK